VTSSWGLSSPRRLADNIYKQHSHKTPLPDLAHLKHNNCSALSRQSPLTGGIDLKWGPKISRKARKPISDHPSLRSNQTKWTTLMPHESGRQRSELPLYTNLLGCGIQKTDYIGGTPHVTLRQSQFTTPIARPTRISNSTD
jgi:hypothetical protein